MMRQFFLIILLGFFASACENKEHGALTSISGEFPALAGDSLFLVELEVRKVVPLDSLKIRDNGAFDFEIQTQNAGFFVLKTADDNLILLQLDGGENIEINSPNNIFKNGYSVSGSKGSEYLMDFEMFMELQKSRIDSLAELYYQARGGDDFMKIKAELDSAYRNIVDDQRAYIINFINDHPGSLAGLILINRSLGQKSVLDEEKDFQLFHRMDSALMINYPDNKHTSDHHTRVMEIQGRIFDRRVAEEKVKPGKKAPDIVLNDTTGNPVSLKSFTGYPTIIYFWAGWSAKAREDNRTLVKLYPDFLKRDIRMLGVSLDENAVVWKGAVKLDQLQWPQVTELNGLHSEISKRYNLSDELPFYYLIDKDQAIVYKNNSLDSLLIHLDQLTLQP